MPSAPHVPSVPSGTFEHYASTSQPQTLARPGNPPKKGKERVRLDASTVTGDAGPSAQPVARTRKGKARAPTVASTGEELQLVARSCSSAASTSLRVKRKRSLDDLVGVGETPTAKRAKGIKKARHEYPDLPEDNSHLIPQDVFCDLEGCYKWHRFDEEEYKNHLKEVHKGNAFVLSADRTKCLCNWPGCAREVRLGQFFRHITDKHVKVWSRKCPECGQSFPRRSNHNFARHYWPCLAKSRKAGGQKPPPR